MPLSPLLFIVIPFAAAFFTTLAGKRIKNFGYVASSLAGLCLLLLSLSWMGFIQSLNAHVFVYKVGGWVPPMGIALVFDSLSTLMLVVVNCVSFLAAAYSLAYIDRYTDKWKFYALFSLMIAGLNGVIISGDLFNLYVFLEIASVSAYALVAFGTEAEDLEAAFKYAIMGTVASIFILLGIALLYGYASTLNMADLARVLGDKPQGLLFGLITVLFIAGFGLKSAMVPFHAWLPDAHPSAPAPVSALLSGVVIKTLGIYSLARVLFNVLGVTQKALGVLLALGVASMVVGAVLAISQKDIKRMFAYSSISQVGYIILALGIATPLAVIGAIFHLINHAFAKSLLFLNSGAIDYATGTRNLDNLGGLNKRMPITLGTSFVGAMSISGIPPLGGFWSKLVIIIACVQAGHVLLALVAVLVSIVTLAYYLRFFGMTFFGSLKSSLEKVKEAPLSMGLPAVALALLCIAAGLMLLPAMRPMLERAADVLLSGQNFKDLVFGAL